MSDTAQIPPSPLQPEQPAPPPRADDTRKSFIATWLFATLLGSLGVDRFYLGKVGTGILKLITFGGFGVWTLIDLILVLTGSTRDKRGRSLSGFEQYRKPAVIFTVLALVASIVVGSIAGTTGRASENRNQPAAAVSTSTASPESAAATPTEPAASAQGPVETTAPAQSVAPAPAAATSSGVQNWAESAFGTFDVVTLTGSGDDLLPLPTAKAAVVTASYQGDGNFAVSVLDAKNESTGELLVNTIGTYSGVSVYGFNALADGVNLQVQASGDWSITIAPVASAPLLATSGSGDSIYRYDGKAGRLDATTDGSGNFAITEETGKAFHYGLLVNEIGAYSGTVPISGGPSVITVTADGNWTLSAH